MNLGGLPLGALVGIVAFGVLCVLIGIACIVAALRQRAVNSETVVLAEPHESLTDGFGVIVYRAMNRVMISTLGGGILIALLHAKTRA